MLGICNGFQVLCESHLLPGALIRNDHRNSSAATRSCGRERRTAWTADYAAGQEIVVPLKNGEGGYVADERTLDELEAEGRVVVRYVGDNPNGSYRDIAGITNERGNVVGLMPHPEHAVEALTGPTHRRPGFFTSVLKAAGRPHEPSTPSRHAEATPDDRAALRELGLKDDEYARIREILGRRPTGAELAMYSVMWSEHCSYKSSKVHLRQFGEKAPQTDALLVGIGENAGVVDIGQGWAVTFKVESHNHPSLRRALPGRGHRRRRHRARHHRDGRPPGRGHGPAAVRPGRRTRTPSGCCPASSRASAATATASGLPNIGGEVVFDPSLRGQPAGQRAVRRRAAARGHPARQRLRRRQPGRPVRRAHRRRRHRRRVGAGLGDLRRRAARPSGPRVQVGDPFMEKVLIECCLEVFAADLVVGIQDLGGAGLSCATSELASNGDGGMHV